MYENLDSILQQIVDSSSFSNKVWGIRLNFVSLPVLLSRCSWLLCAHTEPRQSRWVDLIVALLCCMSVSQPIPLTAGSINIPAAPLIYLAHLLFIPQAKTLFPSPTFPNQMWVVAGSRATIRPWHFDAGVVDKGGFIWAVRTQPSAHFERCYPSQGERCTPPVPCQGQLDWLTEEDVSRFRRRQCSLL